MKALAVAENDTTQLIKKPKSTLTKYISDATTTWTNTSKVTWAEIFQEYQKQMKEYINKSVVASTHVVRMV
jgi:hypothetical protein